MTGDLVFFFFLSFLSLVSMSSSDEDDEELDELDEEDEEGELPPPPPANSSGPMISANISLGNAGLDVFGTFPGTPLTAGAAADWASAGGGALAIGDGDD